MTILKLTEVELDRILIIKQIQERMLTQEQASRHLGISARQIRRLTKRIALSGTHAIISKHTGGNRAFTDDFKKNILTIIKDKYIDFGPTFAAEKLELNHDLKINRETLRQWMITDNIWKGRSRKQARIHQSRERRPRFGELIQIDGSHHDWFEGRGEKCCLLVFIDDATGKIVGLLFMPTETTLGYMQLSYSHICTYGRPIAYYSDKHSIFKTTRTQNIDGFVQDTQFFRALKSLGIELICANSSEAKGRVERANQTLQDRLVKEMRLRNISEINAANAYAPEFIVEFNKRFSVSATSSEDAHRPLYHTTLGLRHILSIQTIRKISKNLELSKDGVIYQIITSGQGYRLRHKAVTICETINGTTEILCDEKILEYKKFIKQKLTSAVDSKELNMVVDSIICPTENMNCTINSNTSLERSCTI